jgi:hypothetical protein
VAIRVPASAGSLSRAALLFAPARPRRLVTSSARSGAIAIQGIPIRHGPIADKGRSSGADRAFTWHVPKDCNFPQRGYATISY